MAGRKILNSWSIRRKLFLLTLAVFLPAAGILFASGLKERNLEISMAQNRALLLVQSLAAQQEEVAIGTRQMLSTLAELPQVQRLDVEACNQLFRELRNRNPFYTTLGALTPEGNLVTNAPAVEAGSVNLLDRKHIQDALSTLSFSVGEYIVGRVTKVPSLNYTYPILGADKKVVGILSAGFELGQYAHFIQKAGLPEDSAVVIADYRGVRLYRFPESQAAPIGSALPKETIAKISGELEQGVFERISDDGIRRLYAFKQLRLRDDSAPYLYLIVGFPKDRITHSANIRTLNNLLALGIAALVALGFSWSFGNAAFIRPINKLVHATQRLGSGELGARTGLSYTPDELGRLAKSFDDMALLLEEKDKEQKEVENLLRESELFTRSTLDALSAHIAILDEDGFILCTNRSWECFGKSNELAGYDFPGVDYFSICDHATGKCAEEASLVAAGIREVISGSRELFEREYPCHSPNEQRWFNVRVTRFKDHPRPRVVLAHEDITTRKMIQDALGQSESRLRDLSAKLLTAQEEERRRVAREVHDNIGSYLTGIKMWLESAVRAAGRGEALAGKLQTLVEMVRHVIRESRRIMTDLRPAVLDDHGIEVTISWLGERFKELYPSIGIDVDVDLADYVLSEQMKVVIFRVVQEALSNAARYSQSLAVGVTLYRRESGVELRIRDDGVGFHPEEAVNRGLGLTSMLERVELTQGTFRIDSSPGLGTTIYAFWPVSG